MWAKKPTNSVAHSYNYNINLLTRIRRPGPPQRKDTQDERKKKNYIPAEKRRGHSWIEFCCSEGPPTLSPHAGYSVTPTPARAGAPFAVIVGGARLGQGGRWAARAPMNSINKPCQLAETGKSGYQSKVANSNPTSVLRLVMFDAMWVKSI